MLSAILPQTQPFGISTCRYGQNGAGFCECGYIHIERAVLYIVDKTKRTARIEPLCRFPFLKGDSFYKKSPRLKGTGVGGAVYNY